MERSERHREGPSGPIRAERYPTVKLDLKHKKTIFALWASQTWRTAQSNHNHSRFTYNNTAHGHNTSVKCGHLTLKGDPLKFLNYHFFCSTKAKTQIWDSEKYLSVCQQPLCIEHKLAEHCIGVELRWVCLHSVLLVDTSAVLNLPMGLRLAVIAYRVRMYTHTVSQMWKVKWKRDLFTFKWFK